MTPHNPPNPTFREKPLGEATVQEIQLELARRSKIGDFCGERLIRLLLDNPTLWEGAIFDRLGVNQAGRRLLPSSMIKLRNIGHNDWNVDTLYALCPSRSAADQLAALFAAEDFGAMVDVVGDREEVDRALGGGDDGAVILRAWWD